MTATGPTVVEGALAHLRRAEQVAGSDGGTATTPWIPRAAAVVGAGTMGVGIATALANHGIPVTLIDRTPEDAAAGMERVRAGWASSVSRGRLDPATAAQRSALVRPGASLANVAGADLVIEAVLEIPALKHEIFTELDRHADADAVLGTNTSGLDIDHIAAATQRPENVIGTHFFSPAHVMRLLEIVPGAATSATTVSRTFALGRLLGKAAVRAGNAPSFIGNAMLGDYLRETHFLVEEGAFPADVDRALTTFGFKMGPFTVGDMAGLGVGIEARRAALAQPSDTRRSALSLVPVDLGRLGQRTSAGWYRYEPGDRTPYPDPVMDKAIVDHSASIGITRAPVPDDVIVQRCLYALVNRAARLLDDGIAARPGDIDVVWTTGYGFPAHQGGPLFWADSIGLSDIVADLRALEASQGPWWKPAAGLVRLAEQGSSFFSDAR